MIECKCGCGEMIAARNSQYRRRFYVKNHDKRKPVNFTACECGCGELTKTQYIHGHNWRGKTRPTRLVSETIECACGCGEFIESIRRKEGGSPYRVRYQYGHGVRAERNHFWKGGVTELGKRFKASGVYRRWRKAVFERDNYTCQECGIRNQKGLGRTVELHADHLKPFAFFPELRTELSNGRTLCADCHRKTNTYGPRVKKLYA